MKTNGHGDQFVKHQLRCRHYLRYVDDFVLLHHDREQLAAWRLEIIDFLRQRLELELKDEGRLCPVGDGIDFLGYIVRPHYRLVRRRVVGNLRERLDWFAKRLVGQCRVRNTCSLRTRREHRGTSGAHEETMHTLRLTAPDREALRATLASYLGHFRHANGHRLSRSLWHHYPWLEGLFTISASGRLQPLWEPASVTSLCSQWRWFKKLCREGIVLLQAGNRVEAHNQDAAMLAAAAGLPLDLHPRRGFTATAGVALTTLAATCRRLRRAGVSHCLVVEEGYLRGGTKRRVAKRWWGAADKGFGMCATVGER